MEFWWAFCADAACSLFRPLLQLYPGLGGLVYTQAANSFMIFERLFLPSVFLLLILFAQ